MDYSLPGTSVHGILQARILEWVAIPFSGIEPVSFKSPALAGGFFTIRITPCSSPIIESILYSWDIKINSSNK